MAKKHILLSSANPIDQRFLNMVNIEMQTVYAILNQKYDAIAVTQRANLSFQTLADTFLKTPQGKDIEYLHYCGHSSSYGISLENTDLAEEVVSLDSLSAILSNRPKLKIVFLNSCSSKYIGQQLIADGQVEVVIETTQPIYDKDAKIFSEYFYLSLLQGTSIQQAFETAKVNLLKTKEEDRGEKRASVPRNPTGETSFAWQLNSQEHGPSSLIHTWRLVEPNLVEPQDPNTINLLCVFPDSPQHQSYYQAVKNTIQNPNFLSADITNEVFVNSFLTLKQNVAWQERISNYHRVLFFLDNESNAFWGKFASHFEASIQQKKIALLLCNDIFDKLSPLLSLQDKQTILIPNLPNYTFELLCQTKTVFEAMNSHQEQLRELLFDVVKPILSTENKSDETSEREERFSSHQQYTCDRIDQHVAFTAYRTQEGSTQKKLHFFYIYGGKYQQHQGLYKRFYHQLSGDFLKNKLSDQTQIPVVLDFHDFVYPDDTQVDTLQTNLTTELMDKLGIPEQALDKTSSRNLAYLIENSPLLKDLKPKDIVCCFIHIPGIMWDETLTPSITRWFIESFCKEDFPATAPQFFFFFSVSYKKRDQYIKEQLGQALKDAQYTTSLPELNMVSKRDVEKWFESNKSQWKNERHQDELFDEYFADEDDEMYMLDIQEGLEKIINLINDSYKDASRHS